MSALKAQAVIDHIKAQCPLLGNRVYHVRAMTDINVEEPTAFVLSRPPRIEVNDGMGALVNQPKQRRFAVILRAPAPRDESEPLVEAADEVDAAMIGWQPESQIQVQADPHEEAEPEGALLTWVLNYWWQDYARHVR